MSISHKKINGLIERVSEGYNDSNYDKDKLSSLCKKIYLIETSVYGSSAQQINNEIRDEIIRRSSEVKKRES